MRKILFLFFIIIILFFSCNNKKELKRLEFNIIKRIAFPLDSTKKGIPEDCLFDYDTIYGIETLILVINRNRLAFYDLSTKSEYHSVPLLKTRELYNFDYINKDSILLYYENDFIIDSTTGEVIEPYAYDNANMQLTDYYGKTKICNYYFNNQNFSDSIKQFDIIPFSINFDERLTYIKEKYFFATQSYDKNRLGQTEELSNKYPAFCYYNIKTGNIELSKSVKFPFLGDSIYYDTRAFKIHSCISANGLPLIRFFYWPEVFEWDYRTDSVKKHKLKSHIFDTIYPLATVNTAPEALTAIYNEIYYDPFNEKYYSNMLIKDYFSGNFFQVTIIADKNFNYLGETTEIDGLGNNPIFTKNYILDYFYTGDSILLTYKILNITDKALQPYIDSVKNKVNASNLKKENVYNKFKKLYNDQLVSLLEYYNIKKTEKDYVLLTIYEGQGCPSCKETMKSIISQNNKVFAETSLYLILTGSKQAVIDGSYESFSNLKFIQDTLAIAQNLAYKEGKYSMLNPRLTVVRNDKIVLDTIYDAFHIESDLIPNLIENLGLTWK